MIAPFHADEATATATIVTFIHGAHAHGFAVPGYAVAVRAGTHSGACVDCALELLRTRWTDRMLPLDDAYLSDSVRSLVDAVDLDAEGGLSELFELELMSGTVRREWIAPRTDCSKCRFGVVPRDVQLRGVDLIDIHFSALETPFVFRTVRGQRLGEKKAEGSGAGPDVATAEIRAHGEYLERSGSYLPRERIVFGSYDGIAKSAPASPPPEAYALFSADQYAQENFAYRPFTRTSQLNWTAGKDLATGEKAYVPAQLVPFPYKWGAHAEQDLCECTTTGISFGPDADFAIDGALSEVIERDALAISWLNRRRARRIRTDYERAAPPGVEYRFYDFSTDLRVPVVLAVSLRPAPGVVFTMAAGCALDPRVALTKAFNEHRMCCEFGALARQYRRPVRDTSRLDDFERHALYYAFGDESVRAPLSFLLDDNRETVTLEEWAAGDWCCSRAEVLDALRGAGLRAVHFDLTPPWMAGTGTIARVVVPGMVPMHPDHARPYLGGARLRSVPAKLGFEAYDLAKGWIPHALP